MDYATLSNEEGYTVFEFENYRIRLLITKEFHHEENTIQITTFKYSGFGGFGY